MKLKIFAVLLLSVVPILLNAQEKSDTIHYRSKYYKEMFPNNVDVTKLLVVLPKALTKTEIDSLMKGHTESELKIIYEDHLLNTQNISKNVVEYIKEYQINCEVISKENYNLNDYPATKFPLIVHPDSLVMDKHFATFAYHMIDVKNDIKYGYVMRHDPDFHLKYFEQLSLYIKRLKQEKSKVVTPTEDKSLAAEYTIYKKQKRTKILAKYVALPVAFVVLAIGLIVIITN